MYLSSIFANGINAAHACEHSLHSCKALNSFREEVLAELFLCVGTGRGIYVFQTYAKYLQFTSPAILQGTGYLLTNRKFRPHGKIVKPYASVYLFVIRNTLWYR